MPITLNCPKCRKLFRVRDELVGRKVRCPACTTVLQVPATLTGAATEQHHAAALKAGSQQNAERTSARPPADEPVTETGIPVSYSDLTIGSEADEAVVTASVPIPAPGSRPEPIDDQTEVIRPHTPTPPRPAPRATTRTIKAEPDAIGDVGDLLSGLKLVQVGIFFLVVPFLAYLGEVVYFMLSAPMQIKDHGYFILFSVIDPTQPGQFGIQNLSLWHEIRLISVLLPLILFFFLVILGRLRCLRAPAVTQSRSLALSSLLMSGLGLIAAIVYVVCEVLRVQGVPYPDLQWTAGMAAIATVLMAEVWFCMFLAQIGWPLGAPKLPREAAWFAGLVILVPIAILIANHYYRLFGIDDLEAQWKAALGPKTRKVDVNPILDQRTERLLVGASVIAGAAALVVLRYSNLIGIARKAVKRHEEPVE